MVAAKLDSTADWPKHKVDCNVDAQYNIWMQLVGEGGVGFFCHILSSLDYHDDIYR